MTAIGVSTLLTHLRLSAATTALRKDSEIARVEVVTGRKGDLSRVLGANVAKAELMRAALDGIDLNRNAISRATLRGGVAQSALSEISSSTSQLNVELLSAIGRGDETAISVSSAEARSGLENAFLRLNARVEGLSIFAGDAADANALGDVNKLLADISSLFSGASSPAQFEADLDSYFNSVGGGFAVDVYKGGAGDLGSLEIRPGELVTVAAKANEPAIKDLLRGLSTIAVAGQAGKSSLRDAVISNATSTIFRATDGVLDIQTRIGIEERRAAESARHLDIEVTILTESYNALTAADPYESASRLQALEAQIEASYILTSRLSRLSLTNFL